MKKAIISVLVLTVVILSGCTYMADERPNRSDKEVWICEEPYYAELYWGETKYNGKFCIGDKEYDIKHKQNHGSYIWIFENVENLKTNSGEAFEYCLFLGKVVYGTEKMTITVTEDYKNVFGGELPVMEFVKYNLGSMSIK